MAPGRAAKGGRGGAGNSSSSNNNSRKTQANNHSRKARGAAAASASANSTSNKSVKSLANVYSVEDEDESKSARRRKQYLDEVDNYEYNVDEIEDEDDEEIDSDDAFDAEDEEKYENFQFYGSKDHGKPKKTKKQADKGKGKGKQVDSEDEDMMDQDDDSEEDEDEESEEEGAEYMDISEMLNQPEEEEVALPKKVKLAGFNDFSDEDDFKFGNDDDNNEDEDEDEDDQDEEEQDEDEDDDEDENEDEDMGEDIEDDSKDLSSFIDSLETSTTKKRKQDDGSASFTKKARKNLRERTEAYDESEYNLQAHRSAAAHSVNADATSTNKKKLDIFDLVGGIQNDAGFSSLKKGVQALESGPKKGKTIETLAAPLPKIVQDRLNRSAAYEETKKEVSKWLPIVQQNRQAEHLAFPLNAPPPATLTNAALASNFDASTAMEKEVEKILIEGGMQEKKLMEFEELALNKMSTEEVEKRRSELRMMRDLMFRDELRAKRVSKIKSKLYRKIKKKERERNALTEEEMRELDPQAAHEERLHAEQQRAQERMTLKHKNTGKWAKDQLKHGNFDPESRQAITEQIERGDKLRRKIQGLDSDEEQSGGESEYSDLEDDDVEGIKNRAFDELADVEFQLAKAEDAAKEAKVGKGVFAMKFMQDAAKRSKLQAQAAAEEFRKEMMDEDEEEAKANDEEWQSVGKAGKKGKKNVAEAGTVIGAGGRMVFGSGVEVPEGKSKDGSTKAVKMNSAGQIQKVALSGGHSTKVQGPVTVKVAGMRQANSNDSDDNDGSANPWLQADKHTQGKIARKNDKGVSKDSSKVDKLQAKIKKQKAGAESDDEVQIDTSSFLTLSKDSQKEHGLQKNEKSKTVRTATTTTTTTTTTSTITSTSSKASSKQSSQKVKTKQEAMEVDEEKKEVTVVANGDSDDEEEEPVMVHAKTTAALSQRDLVARAFANDNVVSEFEREKMETVEADKPKDVDMTLPGWGSWSGKGAKKKKNVIVKKAQPGEGVDQSKRKDAKLAHVIISEKRDKKASAYAVNKIPHPFKTWAQYEDSLRAPVGKEWNTNATFQKMTLPRITTKLGKIIDPLTAPFK
ncbi:hypothetical protein BG004_003929 [Podila humilis]|nr:hypothetical protein BG004_003929 [Podila humilis]